ncbi:MAG: DEAD/DEAH box helicase [Propionicimonas sp.]|nr:DEAD/DEAH box helicase [Propionicimonas sp.]
MLTLAFAGFSGGVELTCDPASAPALQRLRTRFASAVTISHSSLTVDLDEFLVNLDALADWPDDAFHWNSRLLSLVEGIHADSDVVETELQLGQPGPEERAALPGGGWQAPLTDLQRRDVARLLRLRHGANFSVPGAGKTRVALAVFQTRRSVGEVARMMVVAPKSAFEAWTEEAQICMPAGGLAVAQMTGDAAPICDVLLINYERLPAALPALVRWLEAAPSMLLLDEAHRMKLGAEGAWGSACYSLGPYAEHRLILTGTPAPNGRQDLENLFGFVWPGRGRRAVTRAVDNHTLAEASDLLRPLFTRTTKAQLGLPPVDLRYRRVALPPLHREIYDALVGVSAREYADNADAESLGKIIMYLLMAATSPALIAAGSSRYEPLSYRVPPFVPPPGSTLADLMRDLPSYEMSPKYAEAMAIVRANAEAGRKTLVWSTFVRSLTSLDRLMSRYSPAIVHGGTVDRDEQLNRFRSDPDCMVLLSNPATLGEGISLHHVCHDAVFVDRDFAAGRYLQSLDRIHRLGLSPDAQTRISILVADATIDDVVGVRLDDKVRFMLRILDDPAVRQLTDLDEEPSTSGDMDPADVAALVTYLQSHATV